MGGFQALSVWVTGHEPLLSGLAAMVVIAGVVLSPFGHGIRALLGRARARVAGEVPGGTSPTAPPMVEDRPSIAVLPFTNMSDDREQEFLADGMTEDIITGLSLNRLLFVIARNSTFSYKGKTPNIRDVGRELGVRMVLEGSVRRVGETLRVTAQLIDARSGAHLWAQAFDRPLADIFEMQDDITAAILAALTSHLVHAATPEIARARPESLEAWELWQRATADFAAVLDASSRRTSEALLRNAVKKDPTYAVAWAWLGATIACRWLTEPGTDARAGRDEARDCIERAISLGPTDPEVHAVQGLFLTMTGQPAEAIPRLEYATRLNPNDVLHRLMLARALCYSGRPAEALPEIEAVLRLSPRDPFAPMFAYEMALVQFALGRYADSEVWTRRSLAGNTRNFYAWLNLGLALAAQGRLDDAHQAVRDAVRIAPQITIASYEYVLRNLGFEERFRGECLKYIAIAWPPELK